MPVFLSWELRGSSSVTGGRCSQISRPAASTAHITAAISRPCGLSPLPMRASQVVAQRLDAAVDWRWRLLVALQVAVTAPTILKFDRDDLKAQGLAEVTDFETCIHWRRSALR